MEGYGNVLGRCFMDWHGRRGEIEAGYMLMHHVHMLVSIQPKYDELGKKLVAEIMYEDSNF